MPAPGWGIKNGTNLTLDKIGFYATEGQEILGPSNIGALKTLPLQILRKVMKYAEKQGFESLTLKYKRTLYDSEGNFAGYRSEVIQNIPLGKK